MIVYADILRKLSDAGYSSYRIQREKLIPCSSMDRIRKGEPFSTATLDTICGLLHCQPGDLLSWIQDKPLDNPPGK